MTRPPNATPGSDGYAAANSLYHDGRFDDAIVAFRSLLEAEPGHPKARAKLAGLLMHRAGLLGDSGDRAGAIEALREAHGLDPASDKIALRLTNHLSAHASAALADARLDEARHLFEEATRIRRDAVPGALIERLDRLPRGHFHDYAGRPAAGSREFVVVEAGVDGRLVAAYLRHFQGADFLSERRFTGDDAGIDIRAIADTGSIGLADDAVVCALTDGLAERITAAMGSLLPNHLRRVDGMDLLECLTYQIEDIAFALGRKLMLLRDLAASGDYQRAVFIRGTGEFTGTAAPLVARILGEDQVFTISCSAQTEHYDDRATPGLPPVGPARLREPGHVDVPSRPGATTSFGQSRPRLVVLASSGGLHVRNLAPVVDDLSRDHEVIIAVPPEHVAKLDRYRPLVVGDHRRATPMTSRSPRWRSRRALQRAVRDLDGARRPPDLEFLGADFWPAVRHQVLGTVRDGIPRLRDFAQRFRALLRRERPVGLIVSPDRSATARVACLIARSEGVPSVFPQAGLVAASNPRFKPLQADHATVLDDVTAGIFTTHYGADPASLHVTGIPVLALQPVETGVDVPTDTVVTLMLQRFAPEVSTALIKTVGSAVAAMAGARLIVKMHPAEPESDREAFARLLDTLGIADRSEVVHSERIETVLARSSLVVAAFSTVVLEAATQGKLVVCVDLGNAEHVFPFVEEGIAVGAGDIAELPEVLRKLTEDPDFAASARHRQSEYFERNPHLRTTRSENLVADTIRRLCSGSATSKG